MRRDCGSLRSGTFGVWLWVSGQVGFLRTACAAVPFVCGYVLSHRIHTGMCLFANFMVVEHGGPAVSSASY